MARGRQQAAALKVVEGRGRDANGVARDKAGRPINEGPSFQRLTPQAPADLSELEREVWEETADELARLKLTKPIDGPTLVAYVRAYGRLVRASAILDEEGLTAIKARMVGDDRVDEVVAHPMVRVAEAAAAQVVRFATELGCTPASEQRLPGGPKKGDDGPSPFDAE